MAEEAALNFANFFDVELDLHNTHFSFAAAVGRLAAARH